MSQQPHQPNQITYFTEIKQFLEFTPAEVFAAISKQKLDEHKLLHDIFYNNGFIDIGLEPSLEDIKKFDLLFEVFYPALFTFCEIKPGIYIRVLDLLILSNAYEHLEEFLTKAGKTDTIQKIYENQFKNSTSEAAIKEIIDFVEDYYSNLPNQFASYLTQVITQKNKDKDNNKIGTEDFKSQYEAFVRLIARIVAVVNSDPNNIVRKLNKILDLMKVRANRHVEAVNVQGPSIIIHSQILINDILVRVNGQEVVVNLENVKKYINRLIESISDKRFQKIIRLIMLNLPKLTDIDLVLSSIKKVIEDSGIELKGSSKKDNGINFQVSNSDAKSPDIIRCEIEFVEDKPVINFKALNSQES